MRKNIFIILMFLATYVYSNVESNPFSVVFDMEESQDVDEAYNLSVRIRSTSSFEKTFLLKLRYPDDKLELVEGKTSFKDTLEQLQERSYNIKFNPLKEGEGRIKAFVYPYISEYVLDIQAKRLFIVKFIVENFDDSFKIRVLDISEVNTAKKKAAATKDEEETSIIEIDPIKADNDLIDQKISMSNGKIQYRSLRYFYVLAALLILLYLIRRIVKNKK